MAQSYVFFNPCLALPVGFNDSCLLPHPKTTHIAGGRSSFDNRMTVQGQGLRRKSLTAFDGLLVAPAFSLQ
jgi:hypothetical protein